MEIVRLDLKKNITLNAFLKKNINLFPFLERIYFTYFYKDGKGWRKREREMSVASGSCPNQGPNPQPRNVPDWESNQ